MLDRLQSFYHQAHLQALRADFRDLDQHIAGRVELTRMLVKLPEPGALKNTGNDRNSGSNEQRLDEHRSRYAEWLNTLFAEHTDIVRITFLDATGAPGFWLERNTDSHLLTPTVNRPPLPSRGFLESVFRAPPATVLASPLYTELTDENIERPRLHLAGTIRELNGDIIGMVVNTIDVGGLASAYRDTVWVTNSGNYLDAAVTERSGNTAFDDHAGLNELFNHGSLGLWRGDDGETMIWIPLFRTENGEPLWVGRSVDASPLASLWNSIALRGALIALAVLIGTWFVARRFANRLDHLGRQLRDGVQRIIRKNEEVDFNWRGPTELKELGKGLNQLSSTHARNSRNLLAHTRELEESNRFKTEFLANVSHELKTPLNSILVLSKILAEQENLDTSTQEKATFINTAGKDLLGLIDNILELSRIETLDQEVNQQEIDLHQLFSDIVSLMRPQYEQKQLPLSLDISANAPVRIVSDPDKIRQILKNLLSNALKFTDEGEVKVSVKSDIGATHRGLPLNISVTDTGMGIPREKQNKIFDAFHQADGSIRRRFGGTGLGLSISQRLASMLGGSLEVRSEFGTGSTFTLRMPLEYSHHDQDAHDKPSADSSAGTERAELPLADYQQREVLVVEDDIDSLLHISRICHHWNLHVVAVSDEEEMMEVIDDEPQCLLTIINTSICGDVNCDTITGIRKRREGCRIILIHDDCDALPKELAEAADDCLQRPIEAEALKQIFDNYLQ